MPFCNEIGGWLPGIYLYLLKFAFGTTKMNVALTLDETLSKSILENVVAIGKTFTG